MCTKKSAVSVESCTKKCARRISVSLCVAKKNAATFGRSVPIVEVSLSTRNFSGKRGIRTPGPSQVNGFQDRRIRPLCHLSMRQSVCCINMPFFFDFANIGRFCDIAKKKCQFQLFIGHIVPICFFFVYLHDKIQCPNLNYYYIRV